jgi:hypothetical protein
MTNILFHASMNPFIFGQNLGESIFPDTICPLVMSIGSFMHLGKCVSLQQKVGHHDQQFMLH